MTSSLKIRLYILFTVYKIKISHLIKWMIKNRIKKNKSWINVQFYYPRASELVRLIFSLPPSFVHFRRFGLFITVALVVSEFLVFWILLELHEPQVTWSQDNILRAWLLMDLFGLTYGKIRRIVLLASACNKSWTGGLCWFDGNLWARFALTGREKQTSGKFVRLWFFAREILLP